MSLNISEFRINIQLWFLYIQAYNVSIYGQNFKKGVTLQYHGLLLKSKPLDLHHIIIRFVASTITVWWILDALILFGIYEFVMVLQWYQVKKLEILHEEEGGFCPCKCCFTSPIESLKWLVSSCDAVHLHCKKNRLLCLRIYSKANSFRKRGFKDMLKTQSIYQMAIF